MNPSDVMLCTCNWIIFVCLRVKRVSLTNINTQREDELHFSLYFTSDLDRTVFVFSFYVINVIHFSVDTCTILMIDNKKRTFKQQLIEIFQKCFDMYIFHIRCVTLKRALTSNSSQLEIASV